MTETTDDETAQWLTWRATGLGASDIARAHTGLYGGRYSVVAGKLGRLDGSNPIDPADAQRGHAWEQAIADGVHALTGYYVHGEQLQCTSPLNERWLATIDGLLDPRPEIQSIDDAVAVLEVKTSRQFVTPKWDYYAAQVQWQMLVTGKQRALVAVAVIGLDLDGNEGVRDLKLWWVERDDHLIGQLVELANELWVLVEAGELPEPDESTSVDDVKQVHRHAVPAATVQLDADVSDEVAEWVELKEQAKAAADAAKVIEARLRQRMGEAVEAYTPDGGWRIRVGEPVKRFTGHSEDAALLLHPEYGKTVLDRYRFKADHPAIYDDLKVDTTDRRLTVREMTDD